MSIPVSLDRVAEAMAAVGPGYLLTTTEGRVKVVMVEPTSDERGLLVAEPGRGTLANVTANPVVTLTFPPAERHGFTLIVDGTAEVAGADVRLAPTGAVWHRPAAHADGPPPPGADSATVSPTGCGDDCHPV